MMYNGYYTVTKGTRRQRSTIVHKLTSDSIDYICDCIDSEGVTMDRSKVDPDAGFSTGYVYTEDYSVCITYQIVKNNKEQA